MRFRFLASVGALAVVVVLLKLLAIPAAAGQAPAAAAKAAAAANRGPALKTPWGDPDLQGIWYEVYQTPLQRPARFAGKPLLTDEEAAALDKTRAALPRRAYRDRDSNGKGTEQDVAGAYNTTFMSFKPTGRRTSLIVDPPDGRIPDNTPELKKRRSASRDFQLALMQATETCKKQAPSCRGGKYGPPSPRRAELPPEYNTGRLNRADGPEDRSMPERCMETGLPDVRGYRRIVQSPGGDISIFYDVRQGQGWPRVIPMNKSPHIPPSIRQWRGDSRGHWEGNTLVVDVTNFTAKFDFLGSRENLHLVERWTRLDADTLEYVVTIEDPTTWTRPWTIKQEMQRQDEQANRIYYEPRCVEGNYGLPGMLANTRAEERAFAAGKGPDPARRDISTGGAGGGEANVDPFEGGGE